MIGLAGALKRAGHVPQPTVEVLRGRDAFHALAAEWTDLVHRCALPHQLFQSHKLLSIWSASFPDAGEIVLFVARSGGALAGVLPLAMRGTFGVRRLQPMGLPIGQFSDMLLDPDAAGVAEQIWHCVLASDADILELPRIRMDSPLWNMRDGALVTTSTAAPCANLATRVDGDGPGPAYCPRDRSNVRRRIRRLEERGCVVFKRYQAGDEASAIAGRAVEIKRRSLQMAGLLGSAVKSDGFARFFRLAAADRDCGLMVSAIEVDGEPAGIDLSFLAKGVGFGHVNATEPAFQKDGVGTLLVHHAFASARRSGATRFDLLSPADPYKMHHADGVTAVESRVYPLTKRGRLFANAFHRLAMPAARALLR